METGLVHERAHARETQHVAVGRGHAPLHLVVSGLDSARPQAYLGRSRRSPPAAPNGPSPAPSAGRESHRDPPPEIGKGGSQRQRTAAGPASRRRGPGRAGPERRRWRTEPRWRERAARRPRSWIARTPRQPRPAPRHRTTAAAKKNGHRQLSGPYGASFDGTDGKGHPAKGLTFERRWTRPGVHPYDEIRWETRTAAIGNESGKLVFEQKDVEVPEFWSQLATNVVVSKYFRGHVGTPERETSVRQLIDRVVNTIAAWAETQRYFATDADLAAFQAELTHLLVHQKMSFNSPVWFNVGIEPQPQCSACFINSVQDTMSSIMDLAKTEAMLFKFGSRRRHQPVHDPRAPGRR